MDRTNNQSFFSGMCVKALENIARFVRYGLVLWQAIFSVAKKIKARIVYLSTQVASLCHVDLWLLAKYRL